MNEVARVWESENDNTKYALTFHVKHAYVSVHGKQKWMGIVCHYTHTILFADWETLRCINSKILRDTISSLALPVTYTRRQALFRRVQTGKFARHSMRTLHTSSFGFYHNVRLLDMIFVLSARCFCAFLLLLFCWWWYAVHYSFLPAAHTTCSSLYSRIICFIHRNRASSTIHIFTSTNDAIADRELRTVAGREAKSECRSNL